jgi:pimeloyl-ACP methyl ester carboxylesterase
MPTVTTSDGVDIRYEVVGVGSPVAVLQGGPSNICEALIAGLAPMASEHTWIFFDCRGSGRSASAPPETYRFDRIADDLDELRQHLGLPTVAVLAHSAGGFTALHHALRHPTTTERLALVSTTPCAAWGPMALPTARALGPARVARILAGLARFAVLWSWRRDSPERTNAMYAPMSITQEARPELRALVAAQRMVSPDSDCKRHLMSTLNSVDLRDAERRVTCPTLVLYGSRDAAMVAGGRLHTRNLPNAEVHVLPDVGHEPFIEAPEETFAILRRFLSG